MKINYLLYSVAIASAFAACSDELSEVAVKAPANDALASRPNVGEVVLSANAAQTRLTEDGTAFAKGDVVKLFLMDEFLPGTEEWNENMTPWKNQERWFTMYDMVDYIQSNYPYVNNGEGEFENPAAQLVEGNYVAYYQEAQDYRYHDMTNRQDLWSYIAPKIVLDQKSANVYANMENDFYLDYQQFYRNDDATPEGKLVKEMELKPVLNRVKFTIGNYNNAPYRIRRISIKRIDDQAVPTIAYVRPASTVKTGNGWNNEVMNDDLATPALWNNTTKFEKRTEYITYAGTEETFYLYKGGKDAFTQYDARQISYFETTANGHVPYGLKKELSAPAFEYAIEFPGEGHLLNAHAPYTSTERVDCYFAIPVFAADFADYEIRVDGDYLDITKGTASNPGEWVPGYWSESLPTGIANTKWHLGDAFDHDWNIGLGKNWPTGTLTVDFNDMHLLAEELAVQVSCTEELVNKLLADGQAGVTTSYIDLNGTGIEFNSAVKNLIKANRDAIAAQNVPGKEYNVVFSETHDYTVNGDQLTSDDVWTYGETSDATNWYNVEDGNFNPTTALNVTTENVLGLPTNITEISTTYNASQVVTKNISFTAKTIINADFDIQNKTVSCNYNVVVLDGVNINLNATGQMLDVVVLQPNAVVNVDASTNNGSSKITGVNRGKVVLPRTDRADTDGFGWVYGYRGFSHDINDVDLVNAADYGVKEYPAPAPTVYDAWANVALRHDWGISYSFQHDKTYTIVGTLDPVADYAVVPFEPTEPGIAPNVMP